MKTTHTPQNTPSMKWHNRVLFCKDRFELSEGSDKQAHSDWCLAAKRFEEATGRKHRYDPRES